MADLAVLLAAPGREFHVERPRVRAACRARRGRRRRARPAAPSPRTSRAPRRPRPRSSTTPSRATIGARAERARDPSTTRIVDELTRSLGLGGRARARRRRARRAAPQSGVGPHSGRHPPHRRLPSRAGPAPLPLGPHRCLLLVPARATGRLALPALIWRPGGMSATDPRNRLSHTGLSQTVCRDTGSLPPRARSPIAVSSPWPTGRCTSRARPRTALPRRPRSRRVRGSVTGASSPTSPMCCANPDDWDGVVERIGRIVPAGPAAVARLALVRAADSARSVDNRSGTRR